MNFLSSFSLLSAGSGIFGVTFSLLLIAITLGLWTLVLMILHPLHATLFILTALLEYGLITWLGFDLWMVFFSFFGIYILFFIIYHLFLRKIIPLPKTDIEHLLKLCELHKNNILTEEEFKAAKKRLLKL